MVMGSFAAFTENQMQLIEGASYRTSDMAVYSIDY